MGHDRDIEDNRERGSVDDVTALLRQWTSGDAQIRDRVVSLVYPELTRIARRHLVAERRDHTLQPTALINEFFLEFAQKEGQVWNSRSHFLAVASQAMRRLLIDHARGRNALKRGGKITKIEFDENNFPSEFDFSKLLELNDLLDRLAAEEPRMAQVAEMRCFGGLTCYEIGEALDIDERTAKRDWKVAKAWLSSQLRRRATHVGQRLGTR